MSERDLWLSMAGADRAAEARSREDTLAGALADPATRVLETAGDKVTAAGGRLAARAPRSGDEGRCPVWLGRAADGTAWLAVTDGLPAALAGQPFEPGGDGDGRAGLRSLAAGLTPEESTFASTAVTLHRWHRLHPFCARCGSATVVVDAGWRRHCPGCETDHFPRTDPVVIVGITSADGERFLLSRGHGWAEGRFSCPAGFVDAAESLEDAVRREMLEEVGLAVTGIELVGNQVWPFNGQLMCAFSARARSERIVVCPTELAEARWVTREELRAGLAAGTLTLPDRYAAGRWLVERWLGGPLAVPGRDASRA